MPLSRSLGDKSPVLATSFTFCSRLCTSKSLSPIPIPDYESLCLDLAAPPHQGLGKHFSPSPILPVSFDLFVEVEGIAVGNFFGSAGILVWSLGSLEVGRSGNCEGYSVSIKHHHI
ncbi:hypothetical protein RND71_006296 [Anisodus tanguticus]|uniref:Uncharacterized protein n=1 Tax=Anisodus tanguticus TaxID=243964 RepID=A0AAE1STI0_9SOLA|nr:hypothetical protein RND71_006296 [Anisodus tanguticus]